MLTYLRVFLRGWLMVALVAGNSVQVVGGHYYGAGVIGFLISLLWYYNARNAGRSDLWAGGAVYACGAAMGTITGMALTRWIYG